MGAVYQAPIGLISFPLSSLVVLWQEFGFDKSVEFAEQDVGKHGAQNGTLGNATKCSVEFPVCYVTLNDPCRPFPGVVDFSKRGVTSSLRPEPVRMFAKCPIKIGV